MKKFIDSKLLKITFFIFMLKIKQLAKSIFFKIFIGILLLSFAFFGVSNFLLNSAGNWVAKVDGKKISYARLQKAMQIDRETILRSNPNNQQAIQYVDSSKFAVDVLSRIVNAEVVNKLRDDYGIEASVKIILQSVTKEKMFQTDGKFDRAKFQQILAQNGFDEARYVKSMQDEIVQKMIMSSFSLISPIDENLVKNLAEVKEEKRSGDAVYVTLANIAKPTAPTLDQLQKFYSENKDKFKTKETREISYIEISKKDLTPNVIVTDADIQNEYEANKQNYEKPQRRDFLHAVFNDEAKAKEFLDEYKKSPSEQNFIKLAKSIAGKDEKTITFKNVAKSDLLPELSGSAFRLNKNENSQILKSPLGFHIFYLTNIKPSEFTPLANLKNDIRKNLMLKKAEELTTARVTAIQDAMVTATSLEDVKKKFNLSGTIKHIVLDQESAMTNPVIAPLDNFAQNAFSLKTGQISKLNFVSKKETIYALKVDKINEAKQKTFEEVKTALTSLFYENQINKALSDLALTIAGDIKRDPKNLNAIVSKYNLKIERNKNYPKFLYIEFQGQKIPYASALLEDVFSLQVGESSSAYQSEKNRYEIVILRDIKKAKVDQMKVAALKKELANVYAQEFMKKFNDYIQSEFSIKANEKFLAQLEGKKEE